MDSLWHNCVFFQCVGYFLWIVAESCFVSVELQEVCSGVKLHYINLLPKFDALYINNHKIYAVDIIFIVPYLC